LKDIYFIIDHNNGLKHLDWINDVVGGELQVTIVKVGLNAVNPNSNHNKLNPYLCEFTGFWEICLKDLNDENLIYLNHYRRIFVPLRYRPNRKMAVSVYPFIFPYSLRQQWSHYHNASDLENFERFLKHKDLALFEVFNAYMTRNKLYPFSMFCLHFKDFMEIMAIVYPLLVDFHNTVNYENRTTYDSRLCGFIGERLFASVIIDRLDVSFNDYLVSEGLEKYKQGKIEKVFSNLVFCARRLFHY
jgi:hypothetical protein